MNCHAMNNTNRTNDEIGTLPIYEYSDDLDQKESVLSFSFDHIYAITPDNVTFLHQQKAIVEACSSNLDKLSNHQSQAHIEVESLKTQLKKAQTELVKLKKLASVHLDLIQQQSDLLTIKDKCNKSLSLENETLRNRNIRQKQNPPPLVSFPTKPQGSKSLLISDPSHQYSNKPKKPIGDPSQPSTSGYLYIKKPSQSSTTRFESYRPEQIIKDPVVSPQTNKTRVEFFTAQGNNIPLFSTSTELTVPDTKLETVECEFDKTDFDIYSIIKSTSQTRNNSIDGSTIYGTAAELNTAKIKEETLDSDDLFDRLSDNGSATYPKVEKSCRDFSYGESLSNINSSVLSNLSDTKGSTSHKTVPWWPSQTTNMVSSDFTDDIETHYEIMAKRKNVVSKGKGKGKGKKSQSNEGASTNDDTTNSLIRNMFIASDVSDIPEKVSTTLSDEPKIKNRFFRSKLVREGVNNNNNNNTSNNNKSEQQFQQDDPNEIYSFDPHEDQKKIKDVNYRSDVDIFDFCVSQQEIEPVLSEIPAEQKKKKHIYDPPTANSTVVKESKRSTSPSASVYSFEDSQETAIAPPPDMAILKRLKSRAFGLFGPEPTDTSMDSANNPSQRVTCYMNAAKGARKDNPKSPVMPSTSNLANKPPISDGRRGRRKSATGNSSIRGSYKNAKTRSRANSLFSPNNLSQQRDRSIPGRGRQRAQSAGSHTSAGSRSKSSCDLNIMKLNSDLEFKNRSFAMISHSEYDFINVSKFDSWKGQETTPINTLEVPKWRIKTLKPAKVSKSEQEEKLDDIVFAKRHTKMELEEKRIKRWDYQRLKELQHLKKLKERQEKLNPNGRKLLYRPFKQRKVIPESLWPSADNVLAIEVVEKLPVSSFGELVPYYKPRKFSLPWIKKKRLRNNSDNKGQH